MILIYDFDGTLTPYSLPQYEILKKFGYRDKAMLQRVSEEMEKGLDFYTAYYKCYKDILAENKVPLTRENICLGVGAGETKFNNGIEEYFQSLQESNTGIKHYVVTSGIKDYVDETLVSRYVNGVYGTTFRQENGIYQDIEFLLSDKKKIDIIKSIQDANNVRSDIIYFGDGLTDVYAFEYVHNIGGETVFVSVNEQTDINYQKLSSKGIIDKCFPADFRSGSEIDLYVKEKLRQQIRNNDR